MSPVKLTRLEAEDAIRRRFTATKFLGELRHDRAGVVETDRWWYFPYCWLGCKGFIVSKDTLYVNWLGSALSLGECFWGHDHGVVCDLVDFTFASDTSRELAKGLVSKFKHMHPNPSGVAPSEPVWYQRWDLEAAVARQFPSFIRHFVWFCIPELMEAYEKEGLRFTSCPSDSRG